MKDLRRWAVAAAVAFAGVGWVGLAARVALGDDRASAAAILDELDRDASHRAATSAIVQRGRDALERATRMRATGDEAHAQLADGLAREEAETGRDLVRALEAERMADEARRAATDAGVVGERERALLEEGIARNGRLRAELTQLGRPQGATSKPAAGDAAGAPKAAKPSPGGQPADSGTAGKTDEAPR